MYEFQFIFAKNKCFLTQFSVNFLKYLSKCQMLLCFLCLQSKMGQRDLLRSYRALEMLLSRTPVTARLSTKQLKFNL